MAEAEKSLRSALALNREHIEAHADLGRLYLKQQRFAEAEKQFERALELKPDHLQARYNLFLLYSRTGRKELAEKQLEIFRALEREEKKP